MNKTRYFGLSLVAVLGMVAFSAEQLQKVPRLGKDPVEKLLPR